ncbi:excisionase family DNA-binding protein [Acrocarpospora sp. B8E8]|uniref:excisionase family DNA-binding protein n=1 Tax=Acrocarpospora sp. B8E8 TaxID=3153572 RepID=UPI00325F3D7A
MELLRMSKAAKRLGIHPMTLRQWAIDGKIPFSRVGRECRFSSLDVENMTRGSDSAISRPRREVLCVRVSGSLGRESSLAAQTGRLYGMRGAEARKRLLAESGQCPREADAA